MNKQELIERFERLIGYGSRDYIERNEVLDLIKQLDEPEKVKIPQFVADFIAEQKKLGHTLSYSIDASMSDRVAEWYWDNSELFALAWIFGYEVDERYRVKFKGFNSSYIILKHHHYDNTWFLGGKQEYEFYRTKHTRKQLEEADFGWVFDCEGVEVKEVKDEHTGTN